MHARSRSSVRIRAVIVAATVATTALVATPAASAAPAPKPGAACDMAGNAKTVGKQTFVCDVAGKKTVWGKPLAVSKSAVTAANAWVKVAKKGEMSAVFVTLRNPTGKTVTLLAAQTAVSATQIHEMAMVDGTMTMQRIAGLEIPAAGEVVLQPGGNHIMLMKLTKPVKAGELLPVTLTMTDGSQVSFKAIGKVFHGANESYSGGSNGESGSMSMG